MCALETFKDVFFSQNFLYLPSVFLQQFFIICFHIHLIKAELNSCDIQANKVLNFCKCFLSEKRWKRDSHQIYLSKIPRHTVGMWRALGYASMLEHCCVYKSINSFRAKILSHSLCISCRSALGLGVCVCMHICVYVYIMYVRCCLGKLFLKCWRCVSECAETI